MRLHHLILPLILVASPAAADLRVIAMGDMP
jgi:hypothetical protein